MELRIKRRKTKGIGNRTCIYITMIVFLHLIGVSYAAWLWRDHVAVSTSISTGKIEPYFYNEENSEYKLVGNDKGELHVEIKDQKITITGEIQVGYNENLFFYIKNRGNIPIKLKNRSPNPNPLILQEIVEPVGIIKEDNQNTAQGKIHIQAKKTGFYHFIYELTFQQWAQGTAGLWEKKLKIEGEIVVTGGNHDDRK